MDYTADLLEKKLLAMIHQKKISEESYIVFVDDGSEDNTWNIIEQMSKIKTMIIGIKLSKNQGHQKALLEGLMYVKDKCDMSISIDADLQDDLDCIDKMVQEFYNGNEIVYGVRNQRDSDSFFKKK